MTATLDLARTFGEEIITLRRALHQVPEFDLDLPKTQQLVLDALAGLPLEITLGKELTSVTAVLRGGAGPGPVVLLRGDASDGLPGVKGVGEKTAASLVTAYGDLDSIRAAAADPTTPMAAGVKRKILDAADYLDVAPKVVAVAKDAPVTVANFQMPKQVLDPERWLDLVELLELGSSAQRVMTALNLGPKS